MNVSLIQIGFWNGLSFTFSILDLTYLSLWFWGTYGVPDHIHIHSRAGPWDSGSAISRVCDDVTSVRLPVAVVDVTVLSAAAPLGLQEGRTGLARPARGLQHFPPSRHLAHPTTLAAGVPLAPLADSAVSRTPCNRSYYVDFKAIRFLHVSNNNLTRSSFLSYS